MNFIVLKHFVWILNRGSVLVVVMTVIVYGFLFGEDILTPDGIQSRLILYGFSLASSTGLVELILNQFNEDLSIKSLWAIIMGGLLLFVTLMFISGLYLTTS